MHETMVAQSVMETVLETAEKHNAKPVSICISCGQFNPLNDEVFKFAFYAIAKETVCADIKIEIIHKPLKSICKNCSEEFDFDVYKPQCPKCSCSEFDFSQDAPLLLENIEIEDTSAEQEEK